MGHLYKKNSMAPGVSFPAMQWLYWLQEQPLLVNKKGKKVQIQHAYYQGEVKVGPWSVDGYAKIDETNLYFEFNGI